MFAVMEAASHLRLVDPDTGELTDAPDLSDALSLVDELRAKIIGYQATIDSQAASIGRLKKTLEDVDPSTHPQHAEIAKLIDHWKQATGHTKARRSKDRFDVVKARLKDGYSFDEMALAIDGIAAFPYVVQGQRVREGQPNQRHDRLGLALENGENLERFAVLGHRARKAGLVEVEWARERA